MVAWLVRADLGLEYSLDPPLQHSLSVREVGIQDIQIDKMIQMLHFSW